LNKKKLLYPLGIDWIVRWSWFAIAVTGCPSLTLVNTSSENRRGVSARGRGSYFLIKDCEGTCI